VEELKHLYFGIEKKAVTSRLWVFATQALESLSGLCLRLWVFATQALESLSGLRLRLWVFAMRDLESSFGTSGFLDKIA
jgi:hypothetical protein